ncbi:Domain of unknown function DUF6874 [Bartonella choladocola]|uniref:DUF6874 family protein n=1 Tax=Bartonella choladocola TaxID=2750995 RepID=UPI003997A24D
MSEALEITRNVSTETTPEEDNYINQILDRAEDLGLIEGDDERYDCLMDLKMLNANGCPMDFKRWLEANEDSFVIDFYSIYHFFDRRTGKLMGFSWPRFAKNQGGESK